ncbi:MAG: hypothetical protein IPO81_16430 [Kouleothrix sp.]|nr:hypothetical protein [Kouleothrix sp.]
MANQAAGVQACVVLAREEGGQQRQLVGYVVGAGEQGFTVAGLRRHLQRQLPDYMVPAAFVELDALPLLPNGKIDRHALLALDEISFEMTSFAPPRTLTEELLSGIWREVLGLAQVGIHDNFFEIGGHSLTATQVISLVREIFQIELPLRELFEAPTVAALAARIDERYRAKSNLSLPPIAPTDRGEPAPLSFAQERLWFFEQLVPNTDTYHIPVALKLKGTLNVAALERSLLEVIRRHEALRTTFVLVNGQPKQVIGPIPIQVLSIIDLGTLPQGEQDAEVRQLISMEARRPFELARGPLLRVMLVRLSEEENVVLLVMHHIVGDGWSRTIFIREVASLYETYGRGQAPALAPLAIQYADFAHWQRAWLQGARLEQHLAYWRRQLAHAPLLDLPTDARRPPRQSFRGAVAPFLLPAPLASQLAALCQQAGATLFMGLLSAFAILLARYSGQTDLLIGAPIANRTHAALEPLIGFFVNTLALRIPLHDAPSFRTLLARVRQVALDAYAHQDVPFDTLVETLQPLRDPSYPPLVQVLLAVQNTPSDTLALPGLELTPLPLTQTTAKFDLTLFVAEQAGALVGSVEYATDLFAPPTIARLIGHFEVLLTTALAQPDQPLPRAAVAHAGRAPPAAARLECHASRPPAAPAGYDAG